MIEFQNVTMQFPGEATPLLQDLSFRVETGNVFVLVGPSGHGKTVILKLIAGLLKPVSGRIFINGIDITPLKGRDLGAIQRRMGMLFQKNALFDSLTCQENLAFPLQELTGKKDGSLLPKIKQMLTAVRLPGVENLYPDELSGGMQKRLGIARALVVDPEMILYDDPTAGLDPITSRHIVDLIMEMQQARSSTSVAVTNDMNRAYQMADTIGLIFKGELLITGSPEETRHHKDPRVHQFVHGLTQGPMTVGLQS